MRAWHTHIHTHICAHTQTHTQAHAFTHSLQICAPNLPRRCVTAATAPMLGSALLDSSTGGAAGGPAAPHNSHHSFLSSSPSAAVGRSDAANANSAATAWEGTTVTQTAERGDRVMNTEYASAAKPHGTQTQQPAARHGSLSAAAGTGLQEGVVEVAAAAVESLVGACHALHSVVRTATAPLLLWGADAAGEPWIAALCPSAGEPCMAVLCLWEACWLLLSFKMSKCGKQGIAWLGRTA